ncbi:MAG TPA: alpha/beta hydrolase [Acidimicrobiales bacterium]|nr:alpha/beta hydrolase [Acidimicrobiales bacterium]
MTATETTAAGERRLELQDGKVVIRVLVAGDGPPVLFLHGAGGLMWDGLLEALAQHFTVYAPEHPGSGQSTGLDELHDLWDLVLHYNDVLDALDVRDAAVVGHAFGGMVAAELAANNPDRVSRLVLIAPFGLWRDDAPIPDMAAIPPARLPEVILADPNSPLAAFLTPRFDDPDALFQAAMRMASILHFIWPIPDKGLSRRIHRVRAPTLLVWGTKDGLVPPVYAEEFTSRLRTAEVVMIDDAGHIPQLEQPDAVQARVLAFLS